MGPRSLKPDLFLTTPSGVMNISPVSSARHLFYHKDSL